MLLIQSPSSRQCYYIQAGAAGVVAICEDTTEVFPVRKPSDDHFVPDFQPERTTKRTTCTVYLHRDVLRSITAIYLKTHLKDRSFRLYANAASNHKLSDVHPWEDLHHIHCLARCFYTGAEIDAKAFGSLLVLPAGTGEKEPRFDYSDLSRQCTLLLRLNDVAFVAVLNDANFANFSFQNHLKKISGPLSPIQLREVMANMAYINEIALNRPRFCTKADFGTGGSWIGPAQPLEITLGETNWERLGEIFHSVAREMIAGPAFPNVEETRRMVRNGRWRFFWIRMANSSETLSQKHLILETGIQVRNKKWPCPGLVDSWWVSA